MDEVRESPAFYGHSRHSVDDKGRVAIPKSFRKVLPPESNGRLIVNLGHDSTIEFHPLTEWKRFEMATLSQLDRDDPEERLKLRVKLSMTVELEMDSACRVLIPKYLLEHGHLSPGCECVFSGMGRYFELSSAAEFDGRTQEFLANFDRYTNKRKPGGEPTTPKRTEQ